MQNTATLSPDAPAGASILEAIPLELHGHRKKLAFIWRCVERYRHSHGTAPSEVRVLEVGCSNGRNISMPLARCGYRVTGIDLHAESIDYAKRHSTLANARFFCQYLEDLDAAERFEIVVLSDILEHVEDPAQICTTALRYLADGGLVLISVPNGYGPYELEQWFLRVAGLNPALDAVRSGVNRVLGRSTAGPEDNADSGHIQFFHLSEFQALLDRVGLRVLERANGALVGGALTMMLIGKLRFAVAATLKIADWMPQRWVSTCNFCCTFRNEMHAR